MEHDGKTTIKTFPPQFKEFDLKFVASKKRLTLDAANPPLEQQFSAFLSLPNEIIQSIILHTDILSKSTLAQLCKKIFFMIDLKFEQQMYQATLKALRKQDHNYKVYLENWYKNSLKLRTFAFDDMKYFHACFGPNILKISPTPFVRARRGVEALFRFKILFEANAVGVFDYLQKLYEDLEKGNNVPWKYINNEEFQIFLWSSVSVLSDQLVVDSVPVKITKGSIMDKIMLLASKYSHIVLRIILSHKTASCKFANVTKVEKFLSDLLQHKEEYPFALTETCPKQKGKISLAYRLTPLELSCNLCFLDLFKVLVQHTPLLPNIGYIANLGLVNSGYENIAMFFDELVAQGAGVNVLLPPTSRKAVPPHLNIAVESALGVAHFACGFRVNSLALTEWLLAKKAKFSDFEMEQILNSPELMARTENIRRFISEGEYMPVSKPINNWQGPKLIMDPEELVPVGSVRILRIRTLETLNIPTRIFFKPERQCQIWTNFERGDNYNGTWSTNENDNVITFCANSTGDNVIEPIYFKYRVFSASNGTALLVTEEQLQARDETLVWLYDLLGEETWME
jgi:hypothetical protein